MKRLTVKESIELVFGKIESDVDAIDISLKSNRSELNKGLAMIYSGEYRQAETFLIGLARVGNKEIHHEAMALAIFARFRLCQATPNDVLSSVRNNRIVDTEIGKWILEAVNFGNSYMSKLQELWEDNKRQAIEDD